MSPPRIDYKHWPFVEVVYEVSMSAEDLDAYGQLMQALFKRGLSQSCVVVFDTRGGSPERATLAVRRRLVQMVNALHKQYPGAVRAEAVVLRGKLAATLYLGYAWLLNGDNVARRSFVDKDEATLWAKSHLPNASPEAKQR